jgi:hypothetical protein
MLNRMARPTLKELLLADGARGELNVPQRGAQRRRALLYLSDAVLSPRLGTAPVRLPRAVVALLQSPHDEDLHLSAVTIGEIQAGAEIAQSDRT